MQSSALSGDDEESAQGCMHHRNSAARARRGKFCKSEFVMMKIYLGHVFEYNLGCAVVGLAKKKSTEHSTKQEQPMFRRTILRHNS